MLPSLSSVISITSSSFRCLSFRIAFILSLSVLHSAKSVLIILPSLMTIHGRELFEVFIFSSLFVAG